MNKYIFTVICFVLFLTACGRNSEEIIQKVQVCLHTNTPEFCQKKFDANENELQTAGSRVTHEPRDMVTKHPLKLSSFLDAKNK